MEEEKEGNEVKEGTYAKVEAYISGDYFPIACRYWRFKYATPIGNWASFTACIGIFFILQSLTKNIIVQKDSSPLKRRAILLCFFLFIIRFFGS